MIFFASFIHRSLGCLLMLLVFLLALAPDSFADRGPTNPHEPARPADSSVPPSPTGAQMRAGKHFFLRGQKLYNEEKYEAAWIEFSSAYEIAPLPDLVYNMARCEVKMGRTKAAIQHYREFLKMRPDDPSAQNIRDEVARLEGHAPLPTPPTVTATTATATTTKSAVPSSLRRVPIAGILLGSGAVLTAILGGMSFGIAQSRFNNLSSTCKPNCDDAQVQTIRTPLNASYALFGIAAAAAVATAVVLPLEIRALQRNRESKVALGLGPTSIYIAGRY